MKGKISTFISIIAVTVILAGSLLGCSKEAKETGKTNAQEENGSSEQIDADGLVVRSSLFHTPAYDTQLYIAKEKGFFEEEFAKDNITLELTSFANGPAANEALIAGQIDIAFAIGDQPMITGIVAGSNATAIAKLSRQTSTQGIYVAADSDITSVADLKGKGLGVAVGTFTHKCVIGILEDNGLSEDDVEIANLLTINEQIAALEGGDIAGFASNYSTTYEYVKAGTLKQLVDFTNHPAATYLVVSNDFIKKYPEVTQRLVNVIVRTQQWANENQEEAAKLVAEFTGQNYDAVYELRSRVDFNLAITQEDIKQTENTYKFLLDHDYVSNELEDTSVIFNDSFITKALAELGK